MYVVTGQALPLVGSDKLQSDGRAQRYEAASQVSLEQLEQVSLEFERRSMRSERDTLRTTSANAYLLQSSQLYFSSVAIRSSLSKSLGKIKFLYSTNVFLKYFFILHHNNFGKHNERFFTYLITLLHLKLFIYW